MLSSSMLSDVQIKLQFVVAISAQTMFTVSKTPVGMHTGCQQVLCAAVAHDTGHSVQPHTTCEIVGVVVLRKMDQS